VEDALLSPPRDATEIESIQLDKIRVLRLFSPHELADDELARTRLAAEMRKDELIRLDLFTRSSPRSLELVLQAFKARGISVFTDAFVHEQLKKKNQPEVMIFTEALAPDDVARLMSDLGARDKKGGGEFEALAAAPFLPADLTRLSRLLGIPNLEPKPSTGKVGVDIRKPLPEGTANDVAAALAKMGNRRTSPLRAERVAVVVSYTPVNPQPSASREIRQFLDRRGERRPDAKPLMLVIRTTK
jgi:hypothetical protein